MAPGEDTDSGMDSLTNNTKEQPAMKPGEDDVLDDDDLDETLSERFWGLGEMFPEKVRNVTNCLASGTWQGVKGVYGFARTVTWILFSSSTLLFAPLIFEIERAQMDEVQKSQQKQVLLGPNSAVSGNGGLGFSR